MKAFFRDILTDLKCFEWWQTAIITLMILIVYGMLLFNPVTAYDFNAAKGDFLHVFLTYFFMHRALQGVIAGVFHDFSPYWTICIGLVFLISAAHLLVILFKRLGFSNLYALLGTGLWFSAPFFFNLSIYQHAFPSAPIGFCCDILAVLAFLELRRRKQLYRRVTILAILLIAASISIYQAHVGLVLTAFLGVMVIDRENDSKGLLKNWQLIIAIMVCSVALWFLFNHAPMLIAKVIGVHIPKSGGAHDTVFWLDGAKGFWLNLKSLFVGFALNWVYNAFFIVGLRWVLIFLVFCSGICIMSCCRKQWIMAISLSAFVLSVFALPVVQCSFANLRTHFSLIPLISFAGMFLVKITAKRIMAAIILTVALLGMAHETSTLYYYNWKVKEHDKLHMSIVAHDIWEKYGLRMEKPVAIIGGWKHYPTCWEDLRPFRLLPLINYPFTTYSNMSSVAVPREFYMVAREKIGLLVPMPDLQAYSRLCSDTALLNAPAYPTPGYIFEREGVIVVNLGKHNVQWDSFRYSDYASPNEQLLDRTFGLSKVDAFLIKATGIFRDLAEEYPWTVMIEPGNLGK